MKKSIFVLILLIAIAGNVCASVEFVNVSLEKTYSQFDTISGKINITLKNQNSLSNITSDLQQSISLIDFLKKNNQKFDITYKCSPSDCSEGYSSSSEGIEEGTFKILIHSSNYIGFIIQGEKIQISQIKFNLSSNFKESPEIPLKLKIFNEIEWKFVLPSEHFSSANYGCYNSAEFVGSEAPYIRSIYCESISITRTPRILAGANVFGDDNKELKMEIYDDALTPFGNCTFNPSNNEHGCIIDKKDSFAEGNYFICVKPKNEITNYRLYSETKGEKCGYAGFDYINENSSADYAIFVKQGLYSQAEEIAFNQNQKGLEQISSEANLFLEEKYNKDCTNGCILPIQIEGINQDVVVKAVSIQYSSKGVDKESNKIFHLSKSPASVDFSGILDLGMTGFNVSSFGNKTFSMYLDEQKLFSEKIKVLASPIIKLVYPPNPPAGVLVDFHADIISNKTITSYVWDFGDKKTSVSQEPVVSHIYENLGAYTLTLNITDSDGLKSTKSFDIIAGDPKSIIGPLIIRKEDSLKKVEESLVPLNSYWYHANLEKMLNISFYKEELSRLKKESESSNDTLSIAIKLNQLKIPLVVIFKTSKIGPMVPEMKKIKPEIINSYSGGSFNADKKEDYQNAIYQWFLENIESTVSLKNLASIDEQGKSTNLISVYNIEINSKFNDESYFVIMENKNKLYFKEPSIAKEVDGSSLIVLDKKSKKTIDFYCEGECELSYFISPNLKNLTASLKIDPCNFNKVCEENLREDSKNCATDCKSFGNMLKILFWPLLVILAGLVVYTILQEWYKYNYEVHLFTDRKYLFNLLMFIDNTRIRKMDDSSIIDELKKKKWNGEQITYALKKSSGKRTGMYELVPIEKVYSWFRVRKVKQKFNKQQNQKIDRW